MRNHEAFFRGPLKRMWDSVFFGLAGAATHAPGKPSATCTAETGSVSLINHTGFYVKGCGGLSMFAHFLSSDSRDVVGKTKVERSVPMFSYGKEQEYRLAVTWISSVINKSTRGCGKFPGLRKVIHLYEWTDGNGSFWFHYH